MNDRHCIFTVRISPGNGRGWPIVAYQEHGQAGVLCMMKVWLPGINRHPNNNVSIKVGKQSDFYLVLLSIAGMKISQGNSSGSGVGII